MRGFETDVFLSRDLVAWPRDRQDGCLPRNMRKVFGICACVSTHISDGDVPAGPCCRKIFVDYLDVSHCVFRAAHFGLQAVCLPRKQVIPDSLAHMTCRNLPHACVNCKCVIKSTAPESAGLLFV